MSKARMYGSVGLGAGLALLAGCAQSTLPVTQQERYELSTRLREVENAPLSWEYLTRAEGKKEGYAEGLDELLTTLIGQFTNGEAKAYLRIYGNSPNFAVRITRLAGGNIQVIPVYDNGDGVPTEPKEGEKGDVNLSERYSDGKPIEYILPESKIPKPILDALRKRREKK